MTSLPSFAVSPPRFTRHDRSKLLVRVTQLLAGQEVGPGSLHRACEAAHLELRGPAAADVIDGLSLAPERGRRLQGGKYA
jgi:hypothetical protein